MSATRFGRLQKATALVPLALLSVAWTASLAASASARPPRGERHRTRPCPTAPACRPRPSRPPRASPHRAARRPGIEGDPDQIVATASTSGIPSAALAAYQRAETVINAADKSCHLSWQLIAAIGRVESNHGRANGNTLDTDGVAPPGIFGVALDGSNGTADHRDTDAGQYDTDAKYDRAVGPMQFIPSTWSVVGVDADGDGKRNPQDIDDAALATAVYLCSGDDDLGTAAGQRAAVFRYNHSQSYVDLVLSIMNAYLDGDFTSVPNGTTSAGFFVPDPNPPAHHGNGHGHGNGNGHGHGNNNGGNTGGGNTGGNTGGDDGDGDLPTDNPTNPGGGDGDGGGLQPARRSRCPAVPATSIARRSTASMLTHARRPLLLQCTRSRASSTTSLTDRQRPVRAVRRRPAQPLSTLVEKAALARCRRRTQRVSGEQPGGLGGPVGEHDVGAGAADRGERLEDRRLAVDPAVGGGGLDHGVLAGDVVRRDRDVDGVADPAHARRGRPGPASPSRCRRPPRRRAAPRGRPRRALAGSCW